jgi:hypothetical protein
MHATMQVDATGALHTSDADLPQSCLARNNARTQNNTKSTPMQERKCRAQVQDTKALELQQAVNSIIPDVWRLLTRLACSLADCRIQPDYIH